MGFVRRLPLSAIKIKMPEIVILVGILGSGKSTFYESNMMDTHERISLDLISGRKREDRLLETSTSQRTNIVIDNTILQLLTGQSI